MTELRHVVKKTFSGKLVVKYACPHCMEKLESKIEEAGSSDTCPGCNGRFVVPGISTRKKLVEAQKSRTASLNDSSEIQIPADTQLELKAPPQPTHSTELSTTTQATGRLVLSSGCELVFDSVYMLRADAIDESERLKSHAINKLTPVSSGIGFIGSFTHVVASSLAVGAVEGLVNSARYKKGQSVMADYMQAHLTTLRTGAFCSLSTITNIQLPDPSLWYSVDPNGLIYRLIDEPFVCVRLSGGGHESIRWSLVEQYRVNFRVFAGQPQE